MIAIGAKVARPPLFIAITEVITRKSAKPKRQKSRPLEPCKNLKTGKTTFFQTQGIRKIPTKGKSRNAPWTHAITGSDASI